MTMDAIRQETQHLFEMAKQSLATLGLGEPRIELRDAYCDGSPAVVLGGYIAVFRMVEVDEETGELIVASRWTVTVETYDHGDSVAPPTTDYEPQGWYGAGAEALDFALRRWMGDSINAMLEAEAGAGD
jgi:hypothetical protein